MKEITHFSALGFMACLSFLIWGVRDLVGAANPVGSLSVLGQTNNCLEGLL
jgi:hypothetical protein